jgi:hypothetical protein
MASTTSRIRIIFDGSSQGLTDEARKARAELKALENDSSKLAGKFETAFAKIGKSALGITAVTGAVHTVGAAVVALQNLAPAALILPGALLATGAAFATLKIGLSGVGDAIKSGDISKLAPEAGRAVVAIRGLSGEFTKLKTSVQGALFKGLAADIKSIGGTYLPILKEGLTGIAVRFNAVGHGLADALKSLGTQNDLRTILNGTAKSLDGLGVSAGAFAQGLLKLGAFGVAQFGNIGKAISGAAAAFNVWVSNGVATGSFQRFFDSAIAGFRSLGGIITNVGSIFASVFEGLSGGGANDPLQSLVKLTGALKEFFKTAEAQGALATLGETFRVIADVTRTVLLEALKQLPPIIAQLGPPVQVIAKALGGALVDAIHIVGPLLTGIASVLNGMGDSLGPVTIGVLALYGAIKLLTIASTVATALGAVRAIIPAIGAAAGAAAPALRILGAALLKAGAVTGLLVVADQLNQINLATAHGDPAKLDDMSHSLNNISGGLREILSGDFAGIFDQINSQWQQTVDNFTTGQSDIGRIFGDIRRAINGINLTPIKFDTSPARADVEALLGEINRATPQITINGNSNPAGSRCRKCCARSPPGRARSTSTGASCPRRTRSSWSSA